MKKCEVRPLKRKEKLETKEKKSPKKAINKIIFPIYKGKDEEKKQ
jgi:hypothetical protein